MTPSKKRQLNVKLSDEAHSLIRKLTAYHGLSQAGLVEYLLRREARREGLLKKGGR